MQLLNPFFGVVFLLALIVSGFAWMFSAHTGMQLLKRLGFGLLLFCVAGMLIPAPGSSLPMGALQIVLVFVLLFAAIVVLINPHASGNLLRILALVGAVALVLVFGLTVLWQSLGGLVFVLGAMAIVALGVLASRAKRPSR